jgi:hypothetical protein
VASPYTTCLITNFLPPGEVGEFEYQIRDLEDGRDLMAREKELRPA